MLISLIFCNHRGSFQHPNSSVTTGWTKPLQPSFSEFVSTMYSNIVWEGVCVPQEVSFGEGTLATSVIEFQK